MTNHVEAITFDWFGTLATHRHKRGRGAVFTEYLASHRLQAAPWHRSILYDVFNYYGAAYRLGFTDEEAHAFWTQFTHVLFERAQVSGCPSGEVHCHASAIRDIFGSGGFELYPDVLTVLNALKQRGIRLAVVSNWPRGLESFCHEMNMDHFFDVIIASADIGIEKPDPRIFGEALRLLHASPESVVHVGDTMDEDIAGALSAGLQAVLLDRQDLQVNVENKITSLSGLEVFLSQKGAQKAQ